MKVKAKLNPKIDVAGWPGFLLWARKERPAQYAELLTRVPLVADFERQVQNSGLGDLSDFFSSMGSALSSVGSTIGSVFTAIAPAALTLGTTLIAAKSAQNLTNTQLQLAQAQRPPAQTATIMTANGPVSVPVAPSGSGYSTSGYYTSGGYGGGGFLASLSSIPITTWLIGAGAVAGVLMLIKRR